MKTLEAYAKAAQIVRSVKDASDETRYDALSLLRLCGRDYVEYHRPLAILPSPNDTHATLELVTSIANERHRAHGTRETHRDSMIASVVRYVIRQDAIERKANYGNPANTHAEKAA